MVPAAVTNIEDRLTKILTPIAALLTAAGGIAGITGVLGPVVRGSERTAFLAFCLMVIGLAALVIVRFFLWEPPAVRERRIFLGVAVVAFCSSLLLFFAVAITAAGRDQRPVIAVSVTAASRTTISGSVTGRNVLRRTACGPRPCRGRSVGFARRH
jgi:drug/metabolite transporter (DMT)-like permease